MVHSAAFYVLIYKYIKKINNISKREFIHVLEKWAIVDIYIYNSAFFQVYILYYIVYKVIFKYQVLKN